jgi:hypothetical protein
MSYHSSVKEALSPKRQINEEEKMLEQQMDL